MAKANAVWGIDIGQCALKALRCTAGTDGTIVADKYDFIEYPKILSQPEADPEELIKEALEQFLSRNEVLGDRVAISVSGQAGLSRFFKPPPVEVKTLPKIVEYEVKQQIPFPIEDVIWDWQQLGGTVVDGRAIDAEVGLFAMKREAVYRALRPFDDAGVEIDLVQLSPLSIFNVVCHDQIEELPDPDDFDPENPPESIVVMSMGTDTTDLIVTNGMKLWLRNIPIGGNHFTKQLSRELKLTQAKAEHLKRNAKVSENPKAIFKAMRPVFTDLVNEVQRSLTFFQSNEKNANLKEVVLLGNAARLPGLRQFLSKQLEMDIAKFSEFKNLAGSEVLSQQTFASNLLSFAPSYGLCLQGLKKAQIKTNLLPREIVVERIIRAKKPWVLTAVSLLMLGLTLGMFFMTVAWWRVAENYADAKGTKWKSAETRVTQKVSASSTFLENDEKLKKDLDKLNLISRELTSASETKSTWLEFYSALTQAFPKDKRIAEKQTASGRVDPNEVEFMDREELYIDHVESFFFADLGQWYTDIEPIYNRMISSEVADDTASGIASTDPTAPAAPAAATDPAAATTDGPLATGSPLAAKPGWVIEIKGHHFHNSDAKSNELKAGKKFLYSTLVKNLMSMDTVVLPTSQGEQEFTYSDIGVTFPTITGTSELVKRKIKFDPTNPDGGDAKAGGGMNGGRGGGLSGGGGLGGLGGAGGLGGGGLGGLGGLGGGDAAGGVTAEDGTSSFEVKEYNFIVQLAWTPRTEKEILEAKAARIKKEEEAAAAAEGAAGIEGEPVAGAAQ